MGVNLTGDPERRDKLKKNIDEKICGMADSKELLYCCDVTDITQTDVSAKFSKSLILIGFPFFSFNNCYIKYRICRPICLLDEWTNQSCAWHNWSNWKHCLNNDFHQAPYDEIRCKLCLDW